MEMDQTKYERFIGRLGLGEHPLGFFYSDEEPTQGLRPREGGRECLIAFLKRARHQGETVYFDEHHSGCPGGAYYLGFRPASLPKIEYFLSCGIPGEMEGERYIKTPERAREYFTSFRPRKARARYGIFKALDRLAQSEEPEVVIFFAPPDVLSGLAVLVCYAAERSDAVHVPFSSGCGAMVTHPLREAEGENPRAVLGMFDVSARPFVEPNVLTFALPTELFRIMLDNQDESFLITESWQKVRERIKRT